MHDILPWVGLGALLLLCLPILPVQRVVLDISTWALRLALVSLLLAGAYLWFQPGDMPERVSAVLPDFPGLLALFARARVASIRTVSCLLDRYSARAAPGGV